MHNIKIQWMQGYHTMSSYYDTFALKSALKGPLSVTKGPLRVPKITLSAPKMDIRFGETCLRDVENPFSPI